LRKLQQRNGKRIEQNKGRSRFPLHKSVDEFDNDFQTIGSKRDANCLLNFGFIDKGQNVVFIGSASRQNASHFWHWH
jgi:DNA replication protein DnaC